MEKPILFMLNPWVEEGHEGPFYCPDCGVVEGFFSYSPEIRNKIEIVWVAYERPRQKVVDCLGQENQGCPVLVLDGKANAPEGARKSLTTGKPFIDDPILICDYLGRCFGGIRPHPQ